MTTPEPQTRLRPIALLACLALLPLLIAAGPPQGAREGAPYALIFGTVWNAEGQAVAGTPIRIRPATEKKAKWRLVSDRRGEFAQRIPAGKGEYVVWADIKRPKGQPLPEVHVQVENDERVDVGIHLTN